MKTRIRIALLLGSLTMLGAAIAKADQAKPAPQKQPVATCNDGKTMYSSNPHEHRGACSGHGGVAAWTDGSPVKTHGGKATEYK